MSDPEETDSGSEAAPGPADSQSPEPSREATDATAHKTGADQAGPPVGTFIVGGVLILLVGVAVLRQQRSKKLKGN